MTKVLVCGGRKYANHLRVYAELDKALDHYGIEQLILIHGACPSGADHFAELWAADKGVRTASVRARWAHRGKGDGHKRNADMLRLGPDMVLAFPGGPGTANMVYQARQAGVPVYVVDDA